MRFLLFFLLLVARFAHADMILLLSDDRAPVMGVAKAIAAAYPEKIDTYNLNGSRARDSEIAHAVLASNKRQVVAVGLLAAQLARQWLTSKQVVFCQVLNYEEFDLVGPSMKGVSGIPSLVAQFSAWKQLDPSLHRVGVITGQHAKSMLREAQAAAQRLGIEIVHVEASSDRAVTFAAQALVDKNVQGLWLAPDSSILSQRAVLDLMAFSVKNGLQVLAFSPSLLREGALIGATPDAREIAQIVLDRLKKGGDAGQIAGDPVLPLQSARIVISAAAAQRFGLMVPAKLKEQVDVQ